MRNDVLASREDRAAGSGEPSSRAIPDVRAPPIRWELAHAWPARLRGLLGRPRPAAGQGLLLWPCRSIHTIGMAYGIDILFLSDAGRVLRVCADVAPVRIRSCRAARGVGELAAGEAARLGIRSGMMVDVPWRPTAGRGRP